MVCWYYQFIFNRRRMAEFARHSIRAGTLLRPPYAMSGMTAAVDQELSSVSYIAGVSLLGPYAMSGTTYAPPVRYPVLRMYVLCHRWYCLRNPYAMPSTECLCAMPCPVLPTHLLCKTAYGLLCYTECASAMPCPVLPTPVLHRDRHLLVLGPVQYFLQDVRY
eukprot:790515-Rhodomonas_salina.2